MKVPATLTNDERRLLQPHWWPLVPLLGWTLLLAVHLWHVNRPAPAAVAVRSHG